MNSWPCVCGAECVDVVPADKVAILEKKIIELTSQVAAMKEKIDLLKGERDWLTAPTEDVD